MMADGVDKNDSLDSPFKLRNGCGSPEAVNGHDGEGDIRSPVEENHDIYFKPIVNLPEVEVVTLEEHESELFKTRAKLYRYDKSQDRPEWKERGTGVVKILKDEAKSSIRLLMRRDKTHKICANHQIMPEYELKPNCGSDRAFVWSVVADFADEVSKIELFAIRFPSVEIATEFKKVFEESKEYMKSYKPESCESNSDDESDDSVISQPSGHDNTAQITEKLKELDVSEKTNEKADTDSPGSSNDKTVLNTSN